MHLALKWYAELEYYESISAIIGGLILGIVISVFGFSKLANKNIARINQYSGKICIWAFQKWTSYLLIAFMMTLGISLRSAGFVPKYILTPMYLGIGFALFTASFRYYLFLYKVLK